MSFRAGIKKIDLQTKFVRSPKLTIDTEPRRLKQVLLDLTTRILTKTKNGFIKIKATPVENY